MNKKIFKIICLTGIIFCSTTTFSQTTTINYLASSLSTTACNVFGPTAVSVNSVSHSSFAGGVKFNSTNGILLGTKANSPIGGTAYIINYSFSPGYNYDISITAKGNSATYLKTSVVSDLNSFLTTAPPYACTLDPNVPLWAPAGYGQFSAQTSTSSATYTVPQFTIPGSLVNPYLVVWVGGGLSNLPLDVLSISKVVITKTQIINPVSFSLPASITFACGTTTPQTFTVTNVNGTTNITNYTWNLGSASNNWLYNGSPATQTISTGTAGSISLTPVCGTVQTNVYATVTANGNTYNTNTSTVSITQPSLSINGSNAFCSGSANYSVTGLPCNASVVWSITPATGVANLSCYSCATTSLSYAGNGAVTLTATVSNVCTGQIIINKSIAVGTSTTTCSEIGAGSGSCIQTNFVCPSQLNNWQYAYIPVPGSWGPTGTGYHLEVHGGGYFSNGLTTQDVTSNYFSVWVPSGGNNITVSGMNGCGVSPYTPYVIVYVPKSYGCSSFYTVSPNPAKSSITVSPNASGTSGINKTSEEKLIDRVCIYSEQGTLLKDRKISKMQTTTLNISALIPGKYFIEVTSGEYKERQIFIVQ